MKIIEHLIKGNQETTFHNFKIEEESENLRVSSGIYYQNNRQIISISDETVLEKPELAEWTQYEIWLTENGIKIYSSAESLINPEKPIDRLGWFTIYSPIPSDEEIELHIVVFEEE